MKYIENWDKKNLRCHFCGSTHSVKYVIDIFDHTIDNKKPTKVCACNKCALLHEKRVASAKPKSITPTLKVFKSPHGTVNVVIQNCPPEVMTLLCQLDIWESHGNFKYNKNEPTVNLNYPF